MTPDKVTLPSGWKAERVVRLGHGDDPEALSLWKVEDGSYIVADATTNKSIRCVSYMQGMDILNKCWENISGNYA